MLEEPHHSGMCETGCRICQKEREILQLKKLCSKKSISSIYQNDFPKQIKKMMKKQKRQSQPLLSPPAQSYVDIRSTYLNDFQKKNQEVQKFRPKDCIVKQQSSEPPSTTYLQSYHTSSTLQVEKPIKCIERQFGNMPFQGKSIYRGSFSPYGKVKVSLPIIQKDSSVKTKKIGHFQTTSMKSFEMNANPEKKSEMKSEMFKPKNNLYSLQTLSNSYQTTYRNVFISNKKPKQNKHEDIDFVGSVYKDVKGRKNFL